MSAPSGAPMLSAENIKGASTFKMFNFNAAYRSPAKAGCISDESDSEDTTRPKVSKQTNLGSIPPTTVSQQPIFQIPAQQAFISPGTAAPKQPIVDLQHEMSTDAEAQELASHLALLKTAASHQDSHELSGTPIFTMPVLKHSKHLFSQYGFLAGMCDVLERESTGEQVPLPSTATDPRLFFNISAPSSAFICGSQGSGKSHTLSCLLENCLMKSHVSKLDNPLAGLVFHYDSFTSDLKGALCEAAHLSSNPNIKVRVLCSPTNLQTIKRTYLGMNVQIEPLRINQSDLNTKRMMDLMAVSQDDGPMPLYLHAINRILREMRTVQQQTNGSFNYAEFKRLVTDTNMTPGQLGPLTQRLDTLESFMPKSQTELTIKGQSTKKQKDVGGNDWTIRPGSLTIVDLSCPCVTSEGACALFNMCLSLFLEQKTTVGRVVALDEAHKYMNSASEATQLTNTLLASIRLQRHLGTRVFISTQEPTISPKLLDLCSFTIVHRFSSPDWLRCLKSHLAALDIEEDSVHTQKSKIINIFNQIVKLRVGEALLFAPSATIGMDENGSPGPEQSRGLGPQIVRLGLGFLKIKIRSRITTDGGKSVLAIGTGKAPVNLKPSGASKSNTTSLFGTAPATASTSTVIPQPQKAVPTTSTFGAPSPTPRIFEGLRVNAPSVPAVENLKTRGTLGLNHTPPVTRTATLPFDVKLPDAGKLVHGTADKNIFGHLNNNAASTAPGSKFTGFTGFSHAKAGGLFGNNNNLNLQENKKPASQITKSDGATLQSTPTIGNLANSLFASSNAKSVLTHSNFIKGANSSSSDTEPDRFCPGTRSSMFIPYTEAEVSKSEVSHNTFQHVCAQGAFLDFSQEELRLADYAATPKLNTNKPVSTLKGL